MVDWIVSIILGIVFLLAMMIGLFVYMEKRLTHIEASIEFIMYLLNTDREEN